MKFCSQCGSSRIEYSRGTGDIGVRYACGDCNVTHYQNPNVVAACIVTFAGRVLLCRRAIEPCSTRWTIPGGYLELGETVEDAVRREAAEEAEVTIGRLSLVALYNVPTFGEVYLVYHGEATAPVAHSGPESSEVRFFLPSEIPWDSLAFPMVSEALTFWLETMERPSRTVQSLDFIWESEGVVSVRRYLNGSAKS